MIEQFFMGNSKNLLKFLKSFLIAIISLSIICVILINALFGYIKHYMYREEARVIYEMELPINHSEAIELNNHVY